MHIHGREERNVEKHGHQDEEREAEAGIDAVRKADTEDVMLVGVGKALELTEKLSWHSSRVGDNEEGISVLNFIVRKSKFKSIFSP